MAMSPTSSSRCWWKDEVGAGAEAAGLNGVRGGCCWLLDAILLREAAEGVARRSQTMASCENLQ